MFAFFTPGPFTLGEKSIGLTAGSGKAGDGEVDLRDEPNELLRLAASIGGFIGRENDVGVPGVEGAGDAITAEESPINPVRTGRSGGAGLPELTRLGGRSILEILPCCASVNWPSFVLRVYMCTERSELCVAMYSLSGSHATPCT